MTDRRTVVFVCTGNICRSPLAEAMAHQLAAAVTTPEGRILSDMVRFESAGTASWHAGDPMDERAHRSLVEAGFEPHRHAAQHASDELLMRADLLVAMDRKHSQILSSRVRSSGAAKIVMLRAFDPAGTGHVDIADPYYGDQSDFDACASIIASSLSGLLGALVSNEV
jgi:protein-tyrosine phosphatase